MWRNRFCGNLALLTALLAALHSCSIIDEDMSDCGVDNDIDYSLKLVTNITTELSTELSTLQEQPVAEALANDLSGIFSDYAHDIDLSFYNATSADLPRDEHQTDIMNANQAQYTLYLPIKNYLHLALANIADAGSIVEYTGDDFAPTARLQQERRDTIDSHRTGLFTARKQMNIEGNKNHTFNVTLYMANAAFALVVDTTGYHAKDMRVFATGFADSYALMDSTYTYNHTPIIRTTEVKNPAATRRITFRGVCFPSKDSELLPASMPSTRLSTEKVHLWQVRAYVTRHDGTVTESILYIDRPLQAAQLRIIKARLKADGSLQPESQEVGVSVTLDWKQGGTYEPEL